ncbi:hypothetical protein BDW71DRAFT_212868 [Aspergillus fruticulosus]
MTVRPQKRIAELAHQLAAFRTTSPSADVSNFEGPTIYLIEYLVTHRSPPRSIKNFAYPPDWEISRSSLNRAYTELIRLADSLEITSSPDFLSWIGENPLPDADQADPAKPLGQTHSRSSSSVSTGSHEKGKAPVGIAPGTAQEAASQSTSQSGDVMPSTPPQPEQESSSDDPLNQPPTVKKVVIDIPLPKHLDKAVRRLSFEKSGSVTVLPSVETLAILPTDQPVSKNNTRQLEQQAQVGPREDIPEETPGIELEIHQPASESRSSSEYNIKLEREPKSTAQLPRSSRLVRRARERGFNFRFSDHRSKILNFNLVTNMSAAPGPSSSTGDPPARQHERPDHSAERQQRLQPTMADLLRLIRQNQEETNR